MEILILTGDGANCFWIGYDDWFVYELHKIEKVKWNVIKEKLVAGTLNKGDLQKTDLYQFLDNENLNRYSLKDFIVCDNVLLWKFGYGGGKLWNFWMQENIKKK